MDNIIPRGQVSTILLSCLIDGDKYGSELLKDLESKSSGKVTIKQPTLYSTLSRMEKQGYISSYWRDSDIGGKRHYYSLTDLGKKFLNDNENKVMANFAISDKIQPKKYYEIDSFEKKDEELLIPKISTQSYSSAKELETPKNVTKTVFTKPLEQQPVKDDGIFLKPNEVYINPKNITKSKVLENQTEEKPTHKTDDGIFITDSLPPEKIPKVKKIDTLNIEVSNSNEITQKLSRPMQIENPMDKIELLYQKTKSVGLTAKDVENLPKSPEETLESLNNRYQEMNIAFYNNNVNNQNIVNTYGKISSKHLFAKYFTIFLLVLAESLGVWLIYYLTNGFVNYSIAYLIIPILSAIPAVYYLFSRKKERNFHKSTKCFWVSACIFIVAVAITYGLNMLLGITLSTMFSFDTTFIYPIVLLTNVLVGGIFDTFYAKKFS